MRAMRYILLGLGALLLLAISVALVLRDFPTSAERSEQRAAATADAPPAPSPKSPASVAPSGDKADSVFAPPPDRVMPGVTGLPASKPAAEAKPEPPPPARLNLTAAQQEKVRDILLTHSIMQAAAADFPLRPGATVPETVPLLPLPHEVADAVPNFQRYSWVIAQDRIVIVLTERREIGFLISI